MEMTDLYSAVIDMVSTSSCWRCPIAKETTTKLFLGKSHMLIPNFLRRVGQVVSLFSGIGKEEFLAFSLYFESDEAINWPGIGHVAHYKTDLDMDLGLMDWIWTSYRIHKLLPRVRNIPLNWGPSDIELSSFWNLGI